LNTVFGRYIFKNSKNISNYSVFEEEKRDERVWSITLYIILPCNTFPYYVDVEDIAVSVHAVTMLRTTATIIIYSSLLLLYCGEYFLATMYIIYIIYAAPPQA